MQTPHLSEESASQHLDKVHFIGVGGVGMSGIARVAVEQGMGVSGSDLRESRYTQQLREAGVNVYIGQDAAHIEAERPDVVVVSTAILDNNPELMEARRRGIPVWHRAKMLAKLGEGKKTVAVAGTHGKTTSSSMAASTLDALGADPTFLIGGIVEAYGSNAHSGEGGFYVVEADESDKSFTHLDPFAVMVTNVEADHLDHYQNLDEIHTIFQDFMELVHPDGFIVACGEDSELVAAARATGRTVHTYGLGADGGFDTYVEHYRTEGVASFFNVTLPDGTLLACGLEHNPGVHNALNAAGVLTLLWGLGCDMPAAAKALAKFSGVRRRFEFVGKRRGVTVVDDYAHHPTEIAATIAAAKALDFKRVHALFQPHRYSRIGLFTDVLRDEFAAAFDQADTVTFMDVYSAGETPVPGVTGETFMEPVRAHRTDAEALHYVPRRLEVVPFLADLAGDGDLVLTLGAGDVTSIGPELVAALAEQE